MSSVQTITPAVSVPRSLEDRIFTAKPKEAEPEPAEDLAVYGEVVYNIANDGKIHIVLPQVMPFPSLRMKKNAKNIAYVEVKVPQVEINVEQHLPDGETREQVLFTEPVEFELRVRFKD